MPGQDRVAEHLPRIHLMQKRPGGHQYETIGANAPTHASAAM